MLRLVDYSGLSRWDQCNHKDPYKKDTGRSKSERNVRMETEVTEEKRYHVTGFKDGEMDHEPKSMCGL